MAKAPRIKKGMKPFVGYRVSDGPIMSMSIQAMQREPQHYPQLKLAQAGLLQIFDPADPTEQGKRLEFGLTEAGFEHVQPRHKWEVSRYG